MTPTATGSRNDPADRTVVIRRVRCPVCDSVCVKRYATKRVGGHTVRYFRCCNCLDDDYRPTYFKAVMLSFSPPFTRNG